MVTWKDSFDRISLEFDVNGRKKQALNNLHDSGRISEFVYEFLNKELTEEAKDIEARRKALAEKMTGKLNELEERRIALEMFLANNEMAYAAGEIDPEIHGKEGNALDLGLDATKQELNWIKEVIVQLVPKENEALEASHTTQGEVAEAGECETKAEKASEPAANVSVEVPVSVTASISEVKTEQVQLSAEAPAPAIENKEASNQQSST